MSWYDTKQLDGKVPVILDLWGMWSTPLLSLLPGSLRPGMVVPDRVPSIGQIGLSCVLRLNRIVWNRSVYIYIYIYIYIWIDLAWNNLQRLICHKTQTNKQTNRTPLLKRRSLTPLKSIQSAYFNFQKINNL